MYFECNLLLSSSNSKVISVIFAQEYIVGHMLSFATFTSFAVQEASGLASIKPDLEEVGVPLYGIVHEVLPGEIEGFQPYLKSEIYLDAKVRPSCCLPISTYTCYQCMCGLSLQLSLAH